MSLVCSFILLIGGAAGFAAEITGTSVGFPARYEGGSLPLNQGRITATIVEDEVVLLDGNQRLAIPLQSITAVTYGTDSHRKSLLRFVPFLDLDKAYYVGLTWSSEGTGNEPASKTNIDAVLKLREGQYRHFVALLERRTGIKAVNTDRLPALVRYDLRSGPSCCPGDGAVHPAI